MKKFETSIIVKPDELNHHNTLFVGSALKYLVETGFCTVCSEHKNPNEVVCYSLNDFKFISPVPNGSILTYTGQIVKVSNTTLTAYVEAISMTTNIKHMSGLITYVIIDEKTREKKSHMINLDECNSEEEKNRRKYADEFFAKIM